MQPFFDKIKELNICSNISHEDIMNILNKIGDDNIGD